MAPTKGNGKPRRAKASRVTNDQSQLDLTNQSAGPGPASERGSPYGQSGHGNPTYIKDTATYTQHRTTNAIGAGPTPPSAEDIARYKSERQHHDLLGVGSHISGTGSIQQDSRMARGDEKVACPYHNPVNQGRLTDSHSGYGLGPMDRFLAEGPVEQSAIFHRGDNGNVSIYKGCRCVENMRNRNSTNGY